MRSFWLCAALVGGVALLSLSACSDSSNVGLGVGPDSLEGGQPVTLDVIPDLDTSRTRPITGENVRKSPPRNQWRFLVGAVDDPIPGTGEIRADGYIDFAGRSSLPAPIISAPDADSLAAELRLPTDGYRHGVSNTPMEVKVYPLTDEAEMDSVRAGASFGADETEPVSVDTAQIVPTDSVATIRLRQSWLSNNLEVLQNTGDDGAAFEDNFPGFKIVAPNGQAVVGFSSFEATLRLTYIPDSTTADYTGLKSFTHVEQRNVTESPPETHRLLQDGVGADLAMEWDFNEPPLDSLQNTPLNRAEIFVPVDTVALNAFSRPNFVRPLPKGFRIIAMRASAADIPSCLSLRLPALPGANEACVVPLVSSAAPSAARVSDNVAFRIFQQSFQRVRTGEGPIFTEFRVEIADRESTSGNTRSTIQVGLPTTLPALVPVDGGDPGPPRATLTVTPL
jgi:hypothetical protein